MMKAFHAGLLVAVMLSGQAAAASLAPVSSDVEILGRIKIAAGPFKGDCDATMYAHIDAMGRAVIEGALTTLEGKSKVCSVAKALGNWPVAMLGGDRMELQKLDFGGPGGMHCRGSLSGTLHNGKVTFAGALKGPLGVKCNVSGVLTSTPTVEIVD